MRSVLILSLQGAKKLPFNQSAIPLFHKCDIGENLHAQIDFLLGDWGIIIMHHIDEEFVAFINARDDCEVRIFNIFINNDELCSLFDYL